MKFHQSQQERGAALIVAMVILFMISILGVSAMQSANIETQLASNSLVKETTFQSAESATDAILAVPNILADVLCQDTPNVTDLTNLNRTTNQTTTATVEYGGQALSLGSSIGPQFSVHRFYVTGTSAVDNMNTSTTIATGKLEFGAASGC